MNPRPERALLALLLAVTIGLMGSHWTSETVSQLKNSSRLCAWLFLKDPALPASAGQRYLLVYDWNKRLLTLAQAAAEQDDVSDLGLTPAFSATEELPSRFGKPGSPEAVKRWLDSLPHNAVFWLRLPQAALRLQRHTQPKPSFYDISIFALELYRLKPWGLRLASIPQSPVDRGKLAALLDTSSKAAQDGFPEAEGGEPVTVRVLNASGEDGVALQATKVLRLQKADVLEFAGAPSLSETTRIIGHAGDHGTADRIRRALGCGMDAEVLAWIDFHARADVTVSLGKDYRQCRALANNQSPY